MVHHGSWSGSRGVRAALAVGASVGLLFLCSVAWPESDEWPFWGTYDPVRLLSSRPEPGEKWTFVAYGNTRAAEFHRNWGVPGLCRMNPNLILNTGNTVKHGGGIWTRDIDWIRWELESGALRDSIPFFPLLGEGEASVREPRTIDHDTQYTGAQHFSRIYHLPGDNGSECFYSFVYGGVTFIALATPEGKLFPGSPQWMWLERTLGEADTPHIVTLSYDDSYTVDNGGHPAWEHAAAFSALLKKYGVKLHISGQDPVYYRTVRDGVTFITSAGGGGEMRPLAVRKLVAPGDVFFTGNGMDDPGKFFYYLVCEVTGGTITVKTVSIRTGTVFDSVTVHARNVETSPAG